MSGLLSLGRGVVVSQSALWETNAVLVEGEEHALLVDPGFEPDEIFALRARAAACGDTTVLVTHADYDHTCGVGLLPDAHVVAGSSTADVIRSGAASEQLHAAALEWGHDWPDALRVDEEIEPGRHVLGPWELTALPAEGHTADGLAFVLHDQRVLVAGDYLSGMTYPFVTAGVGRALATCRRLAAALDEHEVEWVVPGHGRPLRRDEAVTVAREDAAYLERLLEAAAAARAAALPAGRALLHVFAVEPPRPTTADFEVYGIRASNAREALLRG